MPHITFIYPCIGRFRDTKYVRSWQMQPLSIAVLSSLTPTNWDRHFFDDRLEDIDYERPTDVVAISVETYTARRAYQIAAEYRKRGVAVIMGGYHATFCPDEVIQHADAVCVGEAEGCWGEILDDISSQSIKGIYRSNSQRTLSGINPDRDIFTGKNYLRLNLVETSRGCSFSCSFCSITSFFKATHRSRPVEDIVREVKASKTKLFFFVDDNIVSNQNRAMELFRALIPLKISWVSQGCIDAAQNPELIGLMAASGCKGVLVGFETLSKDNLGAVNKKVNSTIEYKQAISVYRKHGILLYGTFMFGMENDTNELMEDTISFAREQKLFLAAFAHVMPFPGTPLYQQIAERPQSGMKKWWLDEEYRFGQVPYNPSSMKAQSLESMCHVARKRFYGIRSIISRGLDFTANCSGLKNAKYFLGINFMMRREVNQKKGLPLGLRDEAEG
ncbi:MAG: B12-binding domain-containing radical SAM protein [Planctomycetes bacterium]|nr:B12-binding domain-containing radical SAM protein [Planctomycetota bacterium]